MPLRTILNLPRPTTFDSGFFVATERCSAPGLPMSTPAPPIGLSWPSSFNAELGEIKFYTGDVDTPVTQLGSTVFTTPTGPIDGVDARSPSV